MGFAWHEPRKRSSSSEPRITIGKQFISLNPMCIEKFFKGKDYVKIGYDKNTKKLILVPVTKEDRYGMKIISNPKSTQRYINAKKAFKNISFNLEEKSVFKCSWDDANNGVLVDIEKDKIK